MEVDEEKVEAYQGRDEIDEGEKGEWTLMFEFPRKKRNGQGKGKKETSFDEHEE